MKNELKKLTPVQVLDKFENFLITIVSRIAPWAAPLAPAYLVARSITEHFEAPVWVGVAVGVTLEAVGVASAHITLEMYDYNTDPGRVKTDPKAPFWLGVVATSVYFISGIVLTVLLEVWPNTVKIAPALFFVLAGVAYVTLTLISNHSRRKDQVAQAKEERKRTPQDAGKLPEADRQLPPWLPYVPESLSEFEAGVSAGEIVLPEIISGGDLAEYIPAVRTDRTGRNWLVKVRNGKET